MVKPCRWQQPEDAWRKQSSEKVVLLHLSLNLQRLWQTFQVQCP